MGISIQTGGLLSYWGAADTFRMIREAGFDGIDWGIDEGWDRSVIQQGRFSPCVFERPLPEVRACYREQLAEIEKNGLTIYQAHAPFPPYVKGFPELTDYAVGIYQKCIRFCDSLGIGRLVIHGVSRALDDPDQTKESVEAMNLRLYRSLIPALRECRVTVCLENLFTRYGRQIIEGACADPRQAAAFIDRLNEEAGRACFGFCVDTGHLNILGKNQEEYILALGERIKAVHLHDNWGDDDRHLAPYAGNIRWREVIGALAKAGYRGNLNFETHQQVSLSRVDRELVPVWLRTIGETGRVFEGWLARG